METTGPDAGNGGQGDETGQKLKLLLDKLHGEDHDYYNKLIQLLNERCEVTILKKEPLDWRSLTENDVLFLIAPNKDWSEAEIETVRSYVESHGGALVVMTIDGRKPERLNKLLETFELSVVRNKVNEKYLGRESLDDSPLLGGVASLAAGVVWAYESISIVESDRSEAVLRYEDNLLGVKRVSGKGTVYLFSCLPVFGNKQLEQADNRIFLDNLLKSLAIPEMRGTLEAIAQDEALAVQVNTDDRALAAQKIVGFIATGYSEDLFFTRDRVLVAKKASIAKFLGWGFMGGMADAVYKGYKTVKLSGLSPDKILKANKHNFAIQYDKISKIEIRKKTLPIGAWKVIIETNTDTRTFDWSLGVGVDVRKHTSFLDPFLSDKLSIVD